MPLDPTGFFKLKMYCLNSCRLAWQGWQRSLRKIVSRFILRPLYFTVSLLFFAASVFLFVLPCSSVLLLFFTCWFCFTTFNLFILFSVPCSVHFPVCCFSVCLPSFPPPFYLFSVSFSCASLSLNRLHASFLSHSFLHSLFVSLPPNSLFGPPYCFYFFSEILRQLSSSLLLLLLLILPL